jgi:hypothetical protein
MKKQNIFILGLIILAIASRLLSHPANFAPIGALAIFAGAYLHDRRSILIVLAALFISDIFIGFYHPMIMLSVYGGFAITYFISRYTLRSVNFARVLATTLTGSILFYIITNFAVWAFGTMYPHSLSGLIASYTMALPFFRNSLAGDIFYTGVLFSAVELAKYSHILAVDKSKA